MTGTKLHVDEFASVVEFVNSAWPGNRTWADPEALYPLFRSVPADPLWRAVNQLFDDGLRGVPKPAQVKALALELVRQADGEGPCTHPYREIVDIGGGYREGRCIRCPDVRTGTADQLPTIAEREDRRRRDTEPTPDVDEPDEVPW